MKTKTNNWIEETTNQFHEVYEKYAPEFGYETRVETRKLDLNSPNGKLMLKVVEEVCTTLLEKQREEMIKLALENKDKFYYFEEYDNGDYTYYFNDKEFTNLIKSND